MSSLDELYKEVILDHYRSPRNRGKLSDADVHLHRDNPLCGDEIDLYLEIEDGRVSNVAFEGKGCSISQASISMMTEKLKGISVDEAEKLANLFKEMMQGQQPERPDDLGDLIALQGVQKYAVRIKCALLGWTTLLDGLRMHAASENQ